MHRTGRRISDQCTHISHVPDSNNFFFVKSGLSASPHDEEMPLLVNKSQGAAS